MLNYQKPTVSALAPATSAIQGFHDKSINSVQDAQTGNSIKTSGLSYDLDE